MNDVSKLKKPSWKTKRFWLNLIVLACASIDMFTGYIRELLPGKEGAAILMLIGGANLFFQIRYSKRFNSAVEKGDIILPEDQT
jgi:hypothetical protein